MEFDFTVPGLVSQHISIWDASALRSLCPEDQARFKDVVDLFGKKSAKSQGLHAPITDLCRLRGTDQRLYLSAIRSQGKTLVLGGLKTGRKKLYVYAAQGGLHEVEPVCVLDFYVHEDYQRQGVGKQLFEYFLATEGQQADTVAYDRPSSKLLAFLSRHYGLRDHVPQSNNYVLYNSFWKHHQQQQQSAVRGEDRDSSGPRHGRRRWGPQATSPSAAAPQQQQGRTQGASRASEPPWVQGLPPSNRPSATCLTTTPATATHTHQHAAPHTTHAQPVATYMGQPAPTAAAAAAGFTHPSHTSFTTSTIHHQQPSVAQTHSHGSALHASTGVSSNSQDRVRGSFAGGASDGGGGGGLSPTRQVQQPSFGRRGSYVPPEQQQSSNTDHQPVAAAAATQSTHNTFSSSQSSGHGYPTGAAYGGDTAHGTGGYNVDSAHGNGYSAYSTVSTGPITARQYGGAQDSLDRFRATSVVAAEPGRVGHNSHNYSNSVRQSMQGSVLGGSGPSALRGSQSFASSGFVHTHQGPAHLYSPLAAPAISVPAPPQGSAPAGLVSGSRSQWGASAYDSEHSMGDAAGGSGMSAGAYPQHPPPPDSLSSRAYNVQNQPGSLPSARGNGASQSVSYTQPPWGIDTGASGQLSVRGAHGLGTHGKYATGPVMGGAGGDRIGRGAEQGALNGGGVGPAGTARQAALKARAGRGAAECFAW